MSRHWVVGFIPLVMMMAMAVTSTTSAAAAPRARPTTSRIRLAPPGEHGDKLVITGRIADHDARPIPGATLDVYHADAMGDYSKPGATAPRLSGTVSAVANGSYRIETVVPSQLRNQ